MTRHIRDNGGGRGFTYCGTAIPRGRGRTDKFGWWPVVKVAREPGEATCRPCRGVHFEDQEYREQMGRMAQAA